MNELHLMTLKTPLLSSQTKPAETQITNGAFSCNYMGEHMFYCSASVIIFHVFYEKQKKLFDGVDNKCMHEKEIYWCVHLSLEVTFWFELKYLSIHRSID